MKKIIVAVFVLTLVASSGFAMAQGWGKGEGMGPGHHGPGGWTSALNLSPEQNLKMQELRESHFKETIPLRNEIMSKRLELRTLWAKTNPDEAKILAKQKEVNALMGQLQEKPPSIAWRCGRFLRPSRGRNWELSPGGAVDSAQDPA